MGETPIVRSSGKEKKSTVNLLGSPSCGNGNQEEKIRVRKIRIENKSVQNGGEWLKYMIKYLIIPT